MYKCKEEMSILGSGGEWCQISTHKESHDVKAQTLYRQCHRFLILIASHPLISGVNLIWVI